jgi:hypothetical protein
MRLTEQTIQAFLYGAVFGSVITYVIAYLHLTREKRMIAAVRYLTNDYGDYLKPPRASGKLTDSYELASDAEIVEFYRWARLLRNSKDPIALKYRRLDSIAVTALSIVCEKLLGLSRHQAAFALLNAKRWDDLPTLLGVECRR